VKARAIAKAKATDDQNGLSALVRIDVGNDLPIQLDHRVPDFNINVAHAGLDEFNGNPNGDIDKEMLFLNHEEESDDAYEPIIKIEPGTEHIATSSSVSNNGVLSSDDDAC
jgi:hypothetical protein